MSTDRLTVSFCCNDGRGNPQLEVTNVEVSELIQLEGPLVFSKALDEIAGVTLIRWSSAGYVAVGGERFPCHGHQRFVGNLLWDATEMDRAEVARLLNHLRELGGWSCHEAEASLFEVWGKREITVEDLERASES